MATATYHGEFSVTFTGHLSEEDVGGEISYWQTFVDDIEVDAVTIADVTLEPKEYAALPQRLRDAIEALKYEVDFSE